MSKTFAYLRKVSKRDANLLGSQHTPYRVGFTRKNWTQLTIVYSLSSANEPKILQRTILFGDGFDEKIISTRKNWIGGIPEAIIYTLMNTEKIVELCAPWPIAIIGL